MSLVAHYQSMPGAGEDLRYESAYMDLKTVISSGDFDAAEAYEQTQALLLRSKDWRLASYACLTASQAKDMRKFESALGLMHALIVEHYETAYPAPDSQRQAIMTWLNHSNTAHFLEADASMTLTEAEACAEMLERIHKQLRSKMGDDAVLWVSLKQLLDKKKSQLKKPTTIQKVSEGLKNLVGIVSEPVEDPQEAQNSLKQIHQCFLKSKWYSKALNVSRVLRWSEIRTPAQTDGKCALDPVRKESKIKLIALDQSHAYEALLLHAEDLFLQQGGQYDLDIQRYAHRACMGLNLLDCAKLIESHLQYFQFRVPECKTLKFNDNTPFCDDSTLGWLDALGPKSDQKQSVEATASAEVETWLAQGQLNKVKEFLEGFKPSNQLERYTLDYILLYQSFLLNDWDFCQAASSALMEKSARENLHAWSPELLKKIWRLQHKILMRQQTSHGKQTPQWQDQWLALQKHVTSQDIPFAANLLSSSLKESFNER